MSDWAPLLAFIGSFLGCGAWLLVARHRLLDVPGARSLHAEPTPTSGGLGMLAGLLLAAGALRQDGVLHEAWCFALLLAAGLSAIGFVDDRRSLPVSARLAAQLLAAGLLLAALWPELGAAEPVALLLPVCLLWLVGFSNLFNFMDGIDGFAASQALFAGGAGAGLALLNGAPGSTVLFLASLAAVALGFLPWNWPPARLFMGDTGSLLLGFLFAAGVVLCMLHGDLPWVVWAILWAPFLIDGLLTLLGRALRAEVLTSAHREHAYQRHALHRGSHRPVTLALLALDVGWLFPLAALALRFPERSTLILLLAVAPVLLIFFRSPAPARRL